MSNPNILCVDIGGTLVKTATVNASGTLISDFITTQTPKPSTPEALVGLITDIVKTLPTFGRVLVGFPGVVTSEHIKTAPNLGTHHWNGFDLENELRQAFGAAGSRAERCHRLWLGRCEGTGPRMRADVRNRHGCALFCNGTAFFGLELGQHHANDELNYDQYIGHAAYLELGDEAWNERAKRVLSRCAGL